MNKPHKATEFPAIRTAIPVHQLFAGHEYPGNDVHARRTNRVEGVEDLAASIASDGLLQSLLVTPSPDADEQCWYVIDGNRRLAALQLLAKSGKLDLDAVPVIVRDGISPGSALALSLAASIHNLPLHIVDRYEAFKAVSGSDADLALRFGTSERIVSQARALGALSPKIRAAWRAGDIKAEAAQAFTLVKDQKGQDKIFDRLQKERRLHPGSIRDAAGVDDDAAMMLKAVGVERAVSAGLQVTENLFGDEHLVNDKTKLKALLSTRIDDMCRDLEAKGWSAAYSSDDVPQGWGGWQRIDPTLKPTDADKAKLTDLRKQSDLIDENDADSYDQEDRINAQIDLLENQIRLYSFTAADMARSVCVLHFDQHEGRIEINSGRIMPKSAKRDVEASTGKPAPKVERKPAAAAKKVEDVDLSQALVADLAAVRTRAAAQAIALEPNLALAAIVAGFATQGPVCVSTNGKGSVNLSRSTSFATVFEEFRKLKPDALLGKLAHVAGAALEISEAGRDKGDDLLLDCIAPNALALALKAHFDPADYFNRVPKALILLAIKEAIGEPEARKRSDLSKADLAAFAAKSVGPTGWLPPELRSAGYAAPKVGKAAAPKAVAKPKAKKKAGKK